MLVRSDAVEVRTLCGRSARRSVARSMCRGSRRPRFYARRDNRRLRSRVYPASQREAIKRAEITLLRLTKSTVIGASLLLLAACGGEATTAADTASGEDSPSAESSSPSSPTSVPPREVATQTSTPSPKPTLTAEDERLMRDFVSFAVDPSPETASRLPLANEVALGLSRDIESTLDVSEAADTSAWVIRAKHFRAYTGPFSALELIQRHAEKARSDSVGGRGAFQVFVGEPPHCASPPVPAPREFKDYRRVSVQPSHSSIDSCLSWFTVDLFLDEQGTVAAITLDLWEP